jgi:hypothetical protein
MDLNTYLLRGGGYCKMTQIDTRGEGSGPRPRIVQKFYKYFFNGPLGLKAHVQEVVGSNPAVYWMDISDASCYIYNEK